MRVVNREGSGGLNVPPQCLMIETMEVQRDTRIGTKCLRLAAQHRILVPLGKHLAQVVEETERKIGSVRSVFTRARSFHHSCVNPKSTALELERQPR